MIRVKVKKDDLVQVLSGKDKGRQAKIEKVILKDGTVFLPGINQFKKHRKSQTSDQPGEIVTIPRPVKISNVGMVCPKCKQITRLGYRLVGDKKIRICRKCEMEI